MKCTVTGVRFQPASFGGGATVAVMVGLDTLMLNGSLVTDAVRPALSVAVPVTVWLNPFVEIDWSGGQLAMPEPVSAQVKCAITGGVRNPAVFAGGLSVTLMVGGAKSMLNGALITDAVFPALSVVVPAVVCPDPSVLMMRAGGHTSMPERSSLHVNCAVTAVRL